MRKRRLSFVCLAVASSLALLPCAGCGWGFLSRLIPPNASTQTPAQLNPPAVLIGASTLSRKIYLQDLPTGPVTDIIMGELHPGKGTEIGIAGSRGAVFVDRNGRIKSSVAFGSPAEHVDIVDVERDGVCEFLNRGSWAINTSLLAHGGKTVWTHNASTGIDDTTAGDINGDGRLEFVVGFNGGGGVTLLSARGKPVWNRSDANVWHVEMTDANYDGRLDIVHSNAAGQITVRDGQGRVIRRAKPLPYFSSFSLCRWPNPASRQYAVLCESNAVWLLDWNGRTVAQLKAPRGGSLGHARATLVKLKPNRPHYFAVLVDFENWQRSILYVYDSTKALVYQEVLPASCASLAALKIGSSPVEALLVGANGQVWQYQARNAQSK